MQEKSIVSQLRFRALSEDRPGSAWGKIVDHGWPGWREWFRARRNDKSPDLMACRRAVRRYLPGVEDLWDDLTNAVDGDEDLAAFLSFWSPPRYLVNCSQIALTDADGPLLIRNYDLDPDLNETTLFRSRWLGKGVIGMVEGMAGLSDGINEYGLAASLTFGGRVNHGEGFGIPFVIRYLLEFCRDVQDAVSVLRGIPSHMSYNVTLADPSGDVATVMLSPDRPAIVKGTPWATNHQLGVEWPKHGRMTKTIERAEYLDHLLVSAVINEAALKTAFLSEPLFSNRYKEGFGTVFTTVYRPIQKTVQIGWQDAGFHSWDFHSPPPGDLDLFYTSGGSFALPPPSSSQELPGSDGRLDAFRSRNQLKEADGWINLNAFDSSFQKEEK